MEAGQPLDANHPLGGAELFVTQPITRQQFLSAVLMAGKK